MPVQLNDKLEGVRPELRVKVEKILTAMSALGFPMFVTDGNRTVAQQQKLYAQGRTTPGKIVTNCDGELKKSNHQDGKAVDCAFSGPNPWDDAHPWSLYGKMAESLGLKWGGSWASSLTDRPHIELP
jgi:peptidoglycan L-alanyl-D-glutamate endopeptidase CwlK